MNEATAASTQMPPPRLCEQPTLSVILPNYNHGKLIARAITALLAQERPPDEIVVVDDGSTDDSVKVIQSLASNAPSMRLIVNSTNEGVIAALSRGLDACQSACVYFAAADDWVLPGFFATAMSMFERHPDAGLVCGESHLISGQTGEHLGVRPVVRPSNQVKFFSPVETAELLRRADNWILTGSTVFSRAHVQAAGGFVADLGSFADGYLARKVALTHGFCFVPRLMATWQVFDHSVSRETASDPAETERLIASAVVRISQDPAFPPGYADVFRRRLQFGIARLAATSERMNETVLRQISSNSHLGGAIVAAAARWPRWRPLRGLLLVWLWFRFRAVSPLLVLRSTMSRLLTRTSSRERYQRLSRDRRSCDGTTPGH